LHVKLSSKLVVWGAVFAAFFGVVNYSRAATTKALVDSRVSVIEETWTVANSLATNAAALNTAGDPTDGGVGGVLLQHGGGVTACVSAESGQTVTSGTMRAYVYMPVASSPLTYRWSAYPSGDWTLTGSVRDQCRGDLQSLSGIGRYAYVEDNVALSGGTTIKVTYSMRSGMPQ
jgi:hypothetical protein